MDCIIPYKVEFSKDLSPMAKLLFGYIFSTCAKYGYFSRTNQDIADRYKCTASQVSRWISSLKNAGFIEIQFIYSQHTRLITSRLPMPKL
jgi:DNA-binding MarR family transcriptional regulator